MHHDNPSRTQPTNTNAGSWCSAGTYLRRRILCWRLAATGSHGRAHDGGSVWLWARPVHLYAAGDGQGEGVAVTLHNVGLAAVTTSIRPVCAADSVKETEI